MPHKSFKRCINYSLSRTWPGAVFFSSPFSFLYFCVLPARQHDVYLTFVLQRLPRVGSIKYLLSRPSSSIRFMFPAQFPLFLLFDAHFHTLHINYLGFGFCHRWLLTFLRLTKVACLFVLFMRGFVRAWASKFTVYLFGICLWT